MTDSFGARKPLKVGAKTYQIYRLDAVRGPVDTLPYTLKILLENLLRRGRREHHAEDIEALANWDPKAEPDREIAFTPARVLLQDFTGVPAVVDLAAMRDAIVKLGGDAEKINPLSPSSSSSTTRCRSTTSARRSRSRRTTRSSSSATRSATRSCAGARARSRTSASCRRTPASCTR